MQGKPVLAGTLDFMSLSDVFQILGGNGSTGVLRLMSPHVPNPGLIYFKQGDPVEALTEAQKGLDAVYALFGWTEGQFEFFKEEVQVARSVKSSRMEIVLDALRMLDDGVIQRVGLRASGEEKEAEDAGSRGIPVIKGPLLDYSHVVGEEDYAKDRSIVREGGHGKWIWVILSGTIEVSRETPKGPIAVSRLREGCYLGAFKSLSFSSGVRSASLRAVTDTTLGLLSTERLSVEFSALSADFKDFLASLDTRLKKATDRVVDVILRQDSLKGLTKECALFLKKGSAKQELYKIRQGKAYVIGETRKGAFPLIALEKDDLFGCIPFLDMGHEPRSAAILGSKDLQMDPIDAAALQKEYEKLSMTLRNMIYNIGTCILMTTKRAAQLHETG